jgi:hypothetical protein
MNDEELTQASAQVPAQLELDLQEALAQRHRAAELFGEPDWPEEDDLEEAD